MKHGKTWIATLLLVGLAVVLPLNAWAGGELTDEDKDEAGDTTTGPYGFVKDTPRRSGPRSHGDGGH